MHTRPTLELQSGNLSIESLEVLKNLFPVFKRTVYKEQLEFVFDEVDPSLHTVLDLLRVFYVDHDHENAVVEDVHF